MDRVERGILNLTSRIVDRVESRVLGVMLVKILAKLRDAMKSDFVRLVEGYGVAMAKRLSVQAVEWENVFAEAWGYDLGFALYLTLINANKPSGWGVV
ncbi:MAG: hypothetical protein ACTSQY_02365 [Candidatus Odinarchaeia archaeon]